MVRLAELIVILELHRQGADRVGDRPAHWVGPQDGSQVIASGLEPPVYGPRPPRVTRLQPFEAYLRERLATVPELTGRRLHRELGTLGYRGGYTAVTDLLREIRPACRRPSSCASRRRRGSRRKSTSPSSRPSFTDEPGVMRIVWLFSLVLGHSRMLWGRFVLHQDMPTLLRCHIAAFEALGGVPQQILYDRMKTAVIRDDAEAGHIVYNRTLLDFARHHGFLPKACRAYRAKTKGKVERPFRYVREDFFLGGRFQTLDDLNAQFRQWQDEVANARVHATTRRVVAEHFAEERPHLLPLPAGTFQAVLRLERRITRDGMVSVGGNLYSVPTPPAAGPVEVHTTAGEVRILEDARVIAVHPVLEGRGQRRIIAGHRSLPPPANSHTPTAGRRPARAGETVAPRPLAFYDAVARRLAAAGPQP